MQTTNTISENISSQEAIELENKYGAHNYKPLPVVLSKGEGVFVWDVEGKRYYDFLSAYSSLNQGHCHKRIVDAVREQAGTLTLTSRAFYNNWLGLCEKFLAETFGYHKVLMMNSGAEAVETAIKLARKWGYTQKNIAEGQAKIITVENNFHGRTTGVISFSTEESSRSGFGPFMPGFEVIPFNNIDALEDALQDSDVCAFMVEPIQGEAGVIVPDEGYLSSVRALCYKYNVLFIADEIQTGLGRTGKLLASQCENVRPDIVTLGKALSGGFMPVSAVLADDEVMLSIKPGEHGSTFGGNPLAARIAIESVKIILEEQLIENAEMQGEYFRERLQKANLPNVKVVRGRGLLNAVEINMEKSTASAAEICKHMMTNGLLAKQTRDSVIRFAPPLIINRQQLSECCDIIENSLREFVR